MHTLTNFLARTKGIEYLLAIILILSFYIVWQLLHRKEKIAALAIRLTPAVLFILIVGVFSFFTVRSSPLEVSQVQETVNPLPNPEVLANMYGPAWLNHDLHKKLVGNCRTCHHYSENSIKQCRECHDTPSDPKASIKPRLAHIYHLRCIGCHKENKIGPTSCTGCHTNASIPPLRSSHPLNQIQNCLSCHGPKGTDGVVRIPPDHAKISPTVCQLCHKPPLDSDLKAMPRIPHDQNRPGCLICHSKILKPTAEGPASHASRTDKICLLCHQAEGE
jgi:multisubunit Na+/H+ antiporter MnhC subunit